MHLKDTHGTANGGEQSLAASDFGTDRAALGFCFPRQCRAILREVRLHDCVWVLARWDGADSIAQRAIWRNAVVFRLVVLWTFMG